MKNSALAAYAEFPRNIGFRDQEPGERIILLLRQHPVTFLPSVLIIGLMSLTPVFLQSALSGTLLDISPLPLRLRVLLLLFWYLLTFGYGILSFLSWFFNIYLVTDRRIIDLDYFGFLFYRLSEAELGQIQDVTHQVGGALRTIFDFGDVTIQTAAETCVFDFSDVPEPAKVHDLITDLIDKLHEQ